MPRALRIPIAIALLVAGARTLDGQTAPPSLSPTLPSDTLEANYGPRSAPGPMPERAPSLPSDTLKATQPVDSFPTGPFTGDSSVHAPLGTPGDSAALRELRSWIQRHPGLISPPPVRAVLVRV